MANSELSNEQPGAGAEYKEQVSAPGWQLSASISSCIQGRRKNLRVARVS